MSRSRVSLPLLAVLLTLSDCGCAHSSYTQLSNGYYIKHIDYFPGVDTPRRRELHYRAAGQHQKLIWRYFNGGIIVHDATAIFVGQKRDVRGGGQRYFLVQSNRPVVNVENEILKVYAERENKDFGKLIDKYGTYKLREIETGVELEYGPEFGVNTPHLFVRVTWQELEKLYDQLKNSVEQHKDAASGLIYIERELKP